MAKWRATTHVINDLLPQVPTRGIVGLHNQALLLVGFDGALRHSELVALDRLDITFDRRGVTILVRTSKTNQAGAGMTTAIVWEDTRPRVPFTRSKPGAITQAARWGHKHSQMLDRSIHDAKRFDDNASGSVDL